MAFFSDLYNETGRCKSHRSRVARKLVKRYDLKWTAEPMSGNNKKACDFHVPFELIERVKADLTVHTITNTAGQIYCFSPYAQIDGRTVFKIGRANQWTTRIKSYRGMNFPKTVYFVIDVIDQKKAEQALIEHCQKVYKQMPWGNEWFFTPEVTFNIESLKKVLVPFMI